MSMCWGDHRWGIVESDSPPQEDLRGARNHVRDLVSAYESKARLPDSLKEILGDGDEGAEASIVREYEELAKKQLMEIVLAKETKPRRR